MNGISKSLGGSIGGVGDWINAGSIVIGATSTAPTKGTTTLDEVRYRVVGQDYEVEYRFKQTVAGSAGVGYYLINLPSGIQFHNSLGIDDTSNSFNEIKTELSVGDANFNNNLLRLASSQVVPYSLTQFRVGLNRFNADSGIFGSGFLQLSEVPLGFHIKLKFRGNGL